MCASHGLDVCHLTPSTCAPLTPSTFAPYTAHTAHSSAYSIQQTACSIQHTAYEDDISILTAITSRGDVSSHRPPRGYRRRNRRADLTTIGPQRGGGGRPPYGVFNPPPPAYRSNSCSNRRSSEQRSEWPRAFRWTSASCAPRGAPRDPCWTFWVAQKIIKKTAPQFSSFFVIFFDF